MENGKPVSFLRACETRASETLTPHFADFFTDFEKKNRLFCSLEHCKLSGRVRLTVVMTQHRTQWW